MPLRLPSREDTPSPDPTTARERLRRAMTDALRTRGLHGVGVAELLSHAQAPKGVLYHHFPGGKLELAVAALRANAGRSAAAIDRLAASGTPLVEGLRAWMHAALQQLEAGSFERGCPLAAAALAARPD